MDDRQLKLESVVEEIEGGVAELERLSTLDRFELTAVLKKVSPPELQQALLVAVLRERLMAVENPARSLRPRSISPARRRRSEG